MWRLALVILEERVSGCWITKVNKPLSCLDFRTTLRNDVIAQHGWTIDTYEIPLLVQGCILMGWRGGSSLKRGQERNTS